MSGTRTAIRPASKTRRMTRALIFLVPMALYAAMFWGGLDSIVMVKILSGTAIAMCCISIILASPAGGASAYFIVGLLIASAAQVEGFGWLTLAYIPYVFLGASLFGIWGAIGFTLSVPIFMAPELMNIILPQDWAVMGLSALAGVIGIGGILKRGEPDTSRRPRGAGYGRQTDDRQAVDEAAPINMDGLMHEDNEALRELLRIAAFAARASAVSLFVRSGDELRLKCSSVAQRRTGDGIISAVPKWYANDVLRLRHTIVTGNLGQESTEGFVNQAAPVEDGNAPAPSSISDNIEEAVSIAASPVLEGSMVTGVLAVSSPRSNAFRGNIVTIIELVSAQIARTLAGGRVYAETERDMLSMKLVYEESARLVSSIDLKEINAILADVMAKISGLDVSIYIRTPSGFALTFQSGPAPLRPGHVDMTGTLAGMAISEGDTRYISNLAEYTVPAIPNQQEHEAISAVLLMPLSCGPLEDALGLVAFTSERTDPLSASTIEQLKMVGKQAGISLKNSMFHTQMKVKAVTDPLTGLSNRRQVMQQLGVEHQRGMRTGETYSVVMMDLDHFKSVNDTWGHQAGDTVLKEVSRRMRSVFRATDILGRYGGEEFIAVLVSTSAGGALDMANRMRKSIEGTPVDIDGHPLSLTMSLGVAESAQGMEPDEIIRRADEALYQAKENGRNRLELWRGGA